MSQHDMNIANALFATLRADLNNALAALVGLSSGATEPAMMFAYMWWADTTTGKLKIRNAANSAWVEVGTLASTNLGLALLAGSASQAFSVAAPSSAAHAMRLDYPGVQNICDFRLTLSTGVPYTTSDVTGATTLYCAPVKTGNRIALFDGTIWNVRASAEFSLALGTLISGKPYDVFCYDNAGVPTLELLVWTNDTTRATSLFTQNGVLSKSGDATRRYMGTLYTTSTTTTEDSEVNRYLFSYYHRVRKSLRKTDSTASWTYTTAGWRQANAAAANQVNVMIGVAEMSVNVSVLGAAAHTSVTGAAAYVGIGVDSTSANSALVSPIPIHAAGAASGGWANYRGAPAEGRHYFAWLEYAIGTTTTFYGTSGATASGISGEVWV